jgi:NIMA-interacting peptidyl-prolyl cis-trans isomerase 1
MRARRLLLLALALVGCSDLTAPPSASSGVAQPSRPVATTRVASPKAPAAPPPTAPTAIGTAAAAGAADSVAASHLLVAYVGSMRADPGVKRTKEEAKQRATEMLGRAKRGEDFAKLAADNSDDPSAKRNMGSLGRFTREQMVKPFADAAFALKPGQLSDLVETAFGYHVIKRTE